MHQHDFSKIEKMNIRSNVVFANQSDYTAYEEYVFGEHTAKMISTETRGVGINRNLSLSYASADICLFADDDVIYHDDMEARVCSEFDAHPDADVIIFHLDANDNLHKQKKYPKTRKCGRFERMPWGGVRIAFRLNSVRKANVWFTTLYGGGCIFPSGEDSMWLTEAKRKGLTFYVSKETIGSVYFEDSTWFTGYDEKFFFGKGAFYAAVHPKAFGIWMRYFCFRTKNLSKLSAKEKRKWMKCGKQGYKEMLSYQAYSQKYAPR